ncbi:MAG: OadG family protein [Candidatus Tenebribacter davisii]|jgi:Na+-transporting methylmalonyl-CoA/oxaloacetate decarboxylase gamma subunit|nr:OadG family protein [Candidatus Tenebribacter davisii]
MKKIITLLMIIWTLTCIAEEKKFSFSPETTILEISAQTNIPVKKITQYLKLKDQAGINSNLQELGISNDDVNNAITEYYKNKHSFYSGIVFVGMGIVFSGLFITGLFISSLQHIGKPRKVKKAVVQTSAGVVTAPKEYISSNGVVAAITAMFLHDNEERGRINLTWKRQSLSMWQAAGMVENRNFVDKRGRK